MTLSKFVPLVGLLAVLMIFSSYTYGVLSENDNQIDVEGTDYEDSYDSNVAIQTASSSLLTPIALIIMIVGFLFAVGMLRRARF